MQSSKRILFLTQYDSTGASTRIRIYQFIPFFEQAGYDCEVRPFITQNYQTFSKELTSTFLPFKAILLLFAVLVRLIKRYKDVVDAWKYDLVIVQKDVLPLFLREILFFGQKKVIYDFDDAIWEPNPGFKMGPLLARLIGSYRSRLLRNMLTASAVAVVDNVYLSTFSEKYCPRTILISAPIDTSVYKVISGGNTQKLVLGWIGSPGTTYLLEEILPLIAELAKSAEVLLINIGGNHLASSQFQIENVSWSMANEKKYLPEMNIGLMPLDDSPFNRGRLGYKIVQYFSSGLPVLGTDTGLNRDVIRDGFNGFLYEMKNKEDFAKKALKMFQDKNLHLEMSANARTTAETKFDVSVQAKLFLSDVNRIVGLV